LIRAIEEAEFADNPSYLAASVGQVLIRHRQWNEALFALETALEHDPQYSEAWAYYGTILDRMDQDGYQALETALTLDPGNPTIHYLLAKHLLAKGDYDHAIRRFRLAAGKIPDNAAILADIGAAYSLKGDTDTALEYFRSAAEIESTNPEFWLLLANFAMEQGIEVESSGIPAARIAHLQTSEMSPDTLDTLGYGYYLVDNTVLAERFFIRALRIDPHHAGARYHLGLLYASMGRIPQARQELSHAVELDPEGFIGDLSRRALGYLDG
jgi:Flp pilus assembly protein TadD